MPIFLAALWGALIPMLGSMVVRVLLSLGIGYVTYLGMDTAVSWAKTQFIAGLVGLPLVAVQLAGLMNVGKCVSMITSAYLGRLTLAGLTSGAVKKLVIK